MPIATHVVNEKFGLDYGFLYELRTSADVEAYWAEIGQPRWSFGFADYLARAETHPITSEGSFIQTVSNATGDAPLLVMGRTMDKVYLGMLRCLPLVVNRNGGFFPLDSRLTIKERRTIDTWFLPVAGKASVSITQWPNGKHFYAKVGDVEVELYGRRKWDTKADAEAAAKRFAKENNIPIE